jgi:hypothetical protein
MSGLLSLATPDDRCFGASLAPHTYLPRDLLRCGALSLLQKPLNDRGIQLNSCLA